MTAIFSTLVSVALAYGIVITGYRFVRKLVTSVPEPTMTAEERAQAERLALIQSDWYQNQGK